MKTLDELAYALLVVLAVVSIALLIANAVTGVDYGHAIWIALNHLKI